MVRSMCLPFFGPQLKNSLAWTIMDLGRSTVGLARVKKYIYIDLKEANSNLYVELNALGSHMHAVKGLPVVLQKFLKPFFSVIMVATIHGSNRQNENPSSAMFDPSKMANKNARL